MSPEDIALRRAIVQAEEEGRTPRLFRLDCGHYKESERLLISDDYEECDVSGCSVDSPPSVLYRITPKTEPSLWEGL